MHELFEGNVSEPSKQDVEFLQQFEPDVFWLKHGKKILAGLAGVALVGLVIYYQQRQAVEQEQAAATRLGGANDPGTLQRLTEEFRGKAIGAQALLRLAEVQAQAGRYKEAAEAFQSFLSQYPSHPMAESAQLGLAAIQEAQGDFQGAKVQYQQILVGHPAGYTAIAAKLGAARCAEGLGLTKEAMQSYEELQAATRGTAWEREVVLRYMVLARAQPVTPATPPAPSATDAAPLTPPSGTTPPP